MFSFFRKSKVKSVDVKVKNVVKSPYSNNVRFEDANITKQRMENIRTLRNEMLSQL